MIIKVPLRSIIVLTSITIDVNNTSVIVLSNK